MANTSYTYTIGRRKTAVATLRLYQQAGENEVNGRKVEKFFKTPFQINKVFKPFEIAGLKHGNFTFTVKVVGGGLSAQSDAICHALARALVKALPETKPAIKKADLLTRDPRMVERKKTGLHKARKAEQYSKR